MESRGGVALSSKFESRGGVTLSSDPGFESSVNMILPNFDVVSIQYVVFYFGILILTVTSHYDFIVEVMK